MNKFLTLFTLVSLPVLSHAQSTDYSWRYYRPGNTGIQGDYATALWVDPGGDPYIAANTGNWGEGGFARFDQANNLWINYSNVDYEILGSFDNGDVQILDIVEDKDQNLWMGTFWGAMRFDPQEGISSVERFEPGNSGLMGYTTDIDVAPDSTIWFNSGGLVRFDPATNQWTYWEGSNIRIAVQPKTDGSYIVWSADVYYGYVFTYNSATNQNSSYLPSEIGEIAGLPGKDCVDDAGNFWALRMSVDGNWETLEYQNPDGDWIYPTPPYENVSFYINAFKAYGNRKALLVTTTGETWMFDGVAWNNYGTWRPGDFTEAIDTDEEGNVWVCGIEGAAKRDVSTGTWQRYRITNTSQIDYFVEDFSLDGEGNVWLAGNAGSGVGGFQKYDGVRWTGFNPYTYGQGYPFPYDADNTQAIFWRPSSGNVIFNPTFHGIHGWDGTNFYPIEDLFSTSQGFEEDSWGRLWSLEEYGGLRRYDEANQQWINEPFTGWGNLIKKDPELPGTIWAASDYQILRTDGTNMFSRTIEDFPGSAAWFTGMAVEPGGIAWIGTWSQFTINGSTLIRIDANTGQYQTWSYDDGWPFPGQHVRPMAITPDGLLWMMFDSEYPSTDAGLCWFDGENVGVIMAAPGGVPQWGGMPNSNIRKLEVREIEGGYELWMSCMGRGMAVLSVITDPVSITEQTQEIPESYLFANPNPATDKVEIGFNMDSKGSVRLSVYDILGKKIKDLLNSTLEEGHHNVEWDLTGETGNHVITGMYVARFSSSGRTGSIKILVR